MRRRSAHLTRVLIESVSSYSPYKGARLNYKRDYDTTPIVNVDLHTLIDIRIAIGTLYKRKELTNQEMLMLKYVMLDGRLSRRDISNMIQKDEGYYIDQRTISRRLDNAYFRISKELGFEFADSRVFKMVAKQRGYPPPYILSEEEIDKVQQIMEKV